MTWIEIAAFLATAIICLIVGAVIGIVLHKPRDVVGDTNDGASWFEVVESVFNVSPSGVVVVDGSDNVIADNRRAVEFGLVVDGHLDEQLHDYVKQVFETEESMKALLSRSGRNDKGKPVGTVGIHIKLLAYKHRQYAVVFGTDVSENVRMEEARRDFVANVSHELKTPVGAMALLAEALLESKNDLEKVEYFGSRVLKESHRMGSMVNELIALSRLQGAERLGNPQVVDLDTIVSEAIQRSRMAADARQIDIVVDDNPGIKVLGDQTLLVTALANLISNGINYSAEGTKVSISREDHFGTAILRVTDHGIGISSEDQKRVFERFFRVDKARSRATGGTGLGLAIVKHVAINHGGSITLWSKPGVGSTFSLEIPTDRAMESIPLSGETEDPLEESRGKDRS